MAHTNGQQYGDLVTFELIMVQILSTVQVQHYTNFQDHMVIHSSITHYRALCTWICDAW